MAVPQSKAENGVLTYSQPPATARTASSSPGCREVQAPDCSRARLRLCPYLFLVLLPEGTGSVDWKEAAILPVLLHHHHVCWTFHETFSGLQYLDRCKARKGCKAHLMYKASQTHPHGTQKCSLPEVDTTAQPRVNWLKTDTNLKAIEILISFSLK